MCELWQCQEASISAALPLGITRAVRVIFINSFQWACMQNPIVWNKICRSKICCNANNASKINPNQYWPQRKTWWGRTLHSWGTQAPALAQHPRPWWGSWGARHSQETCCSHPMEPSPMAVPFLSFWWLYRVGKKIQAFQIILTHEKQAKRVHWFFFSTRLDHRLKVQFCPVTCWLKKWNRTVLSSGSLINVLLPPEMSFMRDMGFLQGTRRRQICGKYCHCSLWPSWSVRLQQDVLWWSDMGLYCLWHKRQEEAPPRVSFNTWENNYSSRQTESSQRHQETLNGPADPFGNTDPTFAPHQLLKTQQMLFWVRVGPPKLLESGPGSAANSQKHWCGQALAIMWWVSRWECPR